MSTPMSLAPILQSLIARQSIERDTMLDVMRQIMRGEVGQEQLAAFLMGLRVKKETVSEIAAAAEVMREFATPVPLAPGLVDQIVDLCGTGGDGQHTFNISTTAMFVAAAAGAKVAKHGGRAVSSASGSADVLEALGVNIHLTPDEVSRCIDELGVGFMFAPNHHAAMRHVAPIRKALGIRTLFNILGPLTNPAGAKRQLMGVFATDLVLTMAEVLRALGAQHVVVVHARSGLDEIGLDGETRVAELLPNGDIHERMIFAQQYGIPAYKPQELAAGLSARSPQEALVKMKEALSNEPGPARDIVLMNAGAALWAGDAAPSLAEGLRMARAVLESGAASRRLQDFVDLTTALAAGREATHV